MATCSECGITVVRFVLKILKDKNISPPCEVSLQFISKETGFTPQLIGSSFDPYIKKALYDNNIIVKKCGTPSRLQIQSRKNNE